MSLLLSPHSYLVILVISLAGLTLIDWRMQLLLFAAPRAAIKTWLALMAFFLAWDVAGVALGIFATNQRYVTGVHIISPNLPAEEFYFLSLLIYVTLLLHQLITRRGRDA